MSRVGAYVMWNGERFYIGSYESRKAAQKAQVDEYAAIEAGTSNVPRIPGTMTLQDFSASRKVLVGTLKRWRTEGMPSFLVRNCVRIPPAEADAWILARYPETIAIGRSPVIYFAARLSDGCVKIGFTSDVEDRLRELRHHQRVDFRLIAVFPGNKSDEQMLHRQFARFRKDGEFFALPFPIDRQFLLDVLLNCGAELVPDSDDKKEETHETPCAQGEGRTLTGFARQNLNLEG